MGARSKKYMMLGYIYNTTKIWKLWDLEPMKVTQWSDIKFDEVTNFHRVERPANEKDVLRLPEGEPIYTEDQITLPPVLKGYTPALQGHTPVLQGHVPTLQGHTPALQEHTPALQEHVPAVEHTSGEAVAATEYIPDEIVSASEWLNQRDWNQRVQYGWNQRDWNQRAQNGWNQRAQNSWT